MASQALDTKEGGGHGAAPVSTPTLEKQILITNV